MMDIFKLDEDEIIDNLSKGNIARVKLILDFAKTQSTYFLMNHLQELICLRGKSL